MRIRFIVSITLLGVALTLSTMTRAGSTLRVGSQVLTAGDSEMRVTELLGKPSHKSRGSRSRHGNTHRRSRRAPARRVIVLTDEGRGEKWQYRHDDHVTTVTIVDGKVSDIEDHRI